MNSLPLQQKNSLWSIQTTRNYSSKRLPFSFEENSYFLYSHQIHNMYAKPKELIFDSWSICDLVANTYGSTVAKEWISKMILWLIQKRNMWKIGQWETGENSDNPRHVPGVACFRYSDVGFQWLNTKMCWYTLQNACICPIIHYLSYQMYISKVRAVNIKYIFPSLSTKPLLDKTENNH